MKRRILITLTGLVLAFASVLPLYAQDAETEERIAAIIEASEPHVNETATSPNAQWQAEITIYDCVPVGDAGEVVAYEVLELTDLEADVTHVLATQLRNCQGLGAFGLSILHWSENNRYLYYTDAREGTPDGGMGDWLRPVIRVDLGDLSLDNFGGGLFSSDRKMLATWNQQDFSVWDTNEGDEALVTFEMYRPEGLVIKTFWLPDNSGLIYVQADSFLPPPTRSYVIHVDVTAATQTLLLESSFEK